MAAVDRRRLRSLALKLVITAALSWILATRLDLAQLWDFVDEIDLGYFMLAALTFGITLVIGALRLATLIVPLHICVPWPRLLRFDIVAHFYGLFLPAGVGISVARWYKVTQGKHSRVEFALVTVLEKASLLVVVCLAVGVPLALIDDPRTAELRRIALPLVGLLFLGMVALCAALTSPRLCAWVTKVAARLRDRAASSRGQLFAGGVDSLAVYAGHFGPLGLGMLWSTLGLLTLAARMGLLLYAVGVELDPLTILWMCSLVFALQTLPISFAGIGVRESAMAYGVGLFGAAPELGALAGLLMFVQVVLVAVLGGLLELLERTDTPAKATTPSLSATRVTSPTQNDRPRNR